MNIKTLIVSLLLFVSISCLGQGSELDSLYVELSRQYNLLDQGEKHKMLDFLRSNITLHYTENYYWIDSSGKKIDFDELKYNDFNKSVQAFEKLKMQKGKLKPIRMRKYDTASITKELIQESIDSSFKYKSLFAYPDNITYEYLLPYRNMTEPLYMWRGTYFERFKYFKHAQNERETIKNIVDNVNQWFLCTYGIETRTDPLPFLGSLQLLHRKKGGCEDIANMMVFALRSIGIPCAIDIIPYWGTSTGGHVLNTAFDRSGSPIHFDALIHSDSLYELVREPAKVFRITYSNNTSTLPNFLRDEDIPNYGLLRLKNYIDVTKEYSNVSDIEFKVPDTINENIIYACTFNGGKWRPVWYGNKVDSSVIISDLVEGVVYLPKIYKNKKFVTIGYPRAYTKNRFINFEPSNELISIKLEELPGYLKFRMGIVYTLYYYDKKWVKIQRKIPNTGTTVLSFDNVPKNALLLLKPEDSKGKERPFSLNDNGERIWW